MDRRRHGRTVSSVTSDEQPWIEQSASGTRQPEQRIILQTVAWLRDNGSTDPLGFVPFDRVGGELLFNLLADRYERRVTTNLAFEEQGTVFGGDEKLTNDSPPRSHLPPRVLPRPRARLSDAEMAHHGVK
jgi:hypothetical protein